MGQALAYDTDVQITSHTVPLPPALVREVTLHCSSLLRLQLPVSQTMLRTQAVCPSWALLMVTRGNHDRYSAFKSDFLQLRCGLKGHQLAPIFIHHSLLCLPPHPLFPPSPLCPPRSLLPARETAQISCFCSSKQF